MAHRDFSAFNDSGCAEEQADQLRGMCGAQARLLTRLTSRICPQLAYQVVPSTTLTYVRVPYKITLTFDTQTSGSTYLNQAVLSQLERDFTLVISRRVIFLSSGGKKKEKMEELPPLKVGHVEKEKSGPRVTLGQSGLTRWQIGEPASH